MRESVETLLIFMASIAVAAVAISTIYTYAHNAMIVRDFMVSGLSIDFNQSSQTPTYTVDMDIWNIGTLDIVQVQLDVNGDGVVDATLSITIEPGERRHIMQTFTAPSPDFLQEGSRYLVIIYAKFVDGTVVSKKFEVTVE